MQQAFSCFTKASKPRKPMKKEQKSSNDNISQIIININRGVRQINLSE